MPDFAKSAATLMALGANRIVMSDSSELGPMDPQWPTKVEGQIVWYSAFDYLGALEAAERLCIAHPENPAFREAYTRFDPSRVHAMRQAIARTRQIAER